jgi:hypothetical protein
VPSEVASEVSDRIQNIVALLQGHPWTGPGISAASDQYFGSMHTLIGVGERFVPKRTKASYGDRSFSACGPFLWNGLPPRPICFRGIFKKRVAL